MKKILAFVFAIAFSGSILAQSSHLLFKNIPINGQLTEFVQKLEKDGLTYVGTQDDMATLTGNLFGYENSKLEVYSSPRGEVHSVRMFLENKSSWEEIKNDYNAMKTMLSEQYGAPADVVEHFLAEGADDSSKMTDVTNGAYAWHCTFITKEGNVELSVAAAGPSQGYVTVKYIDKGNMATMRKK